MIEDDSEAGAVPEEDLPEDERINKPPATDDVKVPAPGDDIPVRDDKKEE